MSTAVVAPKSQALAKELKVNKTQAIMAAEERYKQRVRADIAKLNYKDLFDEFKKDMKEELKVLRELVGDSIKSKTGLLDKYIKLNYDVAYVDEYDEVEALRWESDFLSTEIYEEFYFSSQAPRWFSSKAVTAFKRVGTKLKDFSVIGREHRALKYKLGHDELVKVRRSLKERLKSSQQLSDMQVVNAVLADKNHCDDIDNVLDSLLSKDA